MFRRKTLFRQYFYLSVATIIAITTILSLLIYYGYNSILKEREDVYVIEARKIATDLQDSFKYLDKSLNFLANKILRSNYKDYNNIHDELKKATRFPRMSEDLFTWTMFDFVSTDGYVVADSMTGVLQNPVKIDNNKRSWFDIARSRPWQLHFASPDIGLISGEEIIPTGFGINMDGEFVGILSVGFNIKKFHQKILNHLKPQGASFMIIDSDLKEISKSVYNYKKSKKIDRSKLIDYSFYNNSGVLNPPIEDNGVIYKYYKKVKFSPYIILIGDKKSVINSKLYHSLFPEIILLGGLIIFLCCLVFFFKRKIINPVVDLSIAAEKIQRGDISGNIKIPNTGTVEMKQLSMQLTSIIQYTKELENTQNDLISSKRLLADSIDNSALLKKQYQEIISNVTLIITKPISKLLNYTKFKIENEVTNISNTSRSDELELILKPINYLQTFLSDLFSTINEFSSDKIVVMNQPINITSQINEIIELFMPYAQEKNITLVNLSYNESQKIIGDPKKINLAFASIIACMIEYAQNDISISVNINYSNELNISISDNRFNSDNVTHEQKDFEHNLSFTSRVVQAQGGKLNIKKIPFEGYNIDINLPTNNQDLKHNKKFVTVKEKQLN